MTLALAAFYTAHVFYFLRRQLVDRELLVSFIGLAAFFLAMTMPLVLSREWITASWAIQAFVLLWVAGKLGSEFVRQVGYVLFAVVLFRFCFIDLQTQFLAARCASADLSWRDYLQELVERVVMFGIPIASFAGAYRLLAQARCSRWPRRARSSTGRTTSRPGSAATGRCRRSSSPRFGTLFLYLQLEFNRTFGYFYAPARLPLLTLLWLGMCGLLLYEFLAKRRSPGSVALRAGDRGLLIKLFCFDLRSWGVSPTFVYDGPYSFRDAVLRLVDFGAVVGFLGGAYALLAGRGRAKPTAHGARLRQPGAAVHLPDARSQHVSAQYLPGMQSGGVSIVWSLFALALILRGIARRSAAVRYLGLALFAIVTWKVFFVDLAQLDQFYRIVAFILLGILVLSGSFVYLKYREKFADQAHQPSKESTP